MRERVFVTGVGVVAPNGIGREAFWQALITGLSGVRSIRRFAPSPRGAHFAGEIDIDGSAWFEPHELKKVDRSNVLAVAAGSLAIEDSGLDLAEMDKERIGSAIGNAVCGIEYAQKESDVIYGKGPRWGSPYLAIAFFPCGSNGLLSIRFGLKGPVLTLCNGNTSGSDAVGMAYRMIRSGKADVMLAGGTEAPLIPLFVGSMARDGWLSTRNVDAQEASCPFGADADGMVLSEGSSMLVLESESHARRRGARLYAEIGGYCSANSAFDVYRAEPNGYGIERTMKEVLRSAEIDAADVSWINAQGFSIPEFDQMERRCISKVFGLSDQAAPVSAISAYIGNSIGAMGGMQAAASVLALERQHLPHQAVVRTGAEEYPIRMVRADTPVAEVNVVIQNSFCFMGKSSSLLFKRI